MDVTKTVTPRSCPRRNHGGGVHVLDDERTRHELGRQVGPGDHRRWHRTKFRTKVRLAMLDLLLILVAGVGRQRSQAEDVESISFGGSHHRAYPQVAQLHPLPDPAMPVGALVLEIESLP